VHIEVGVGLEPALGRIPGSVVEDGAVAVSVLGHAPVEGGLPGPVQAAR
jgi:hypothetical protein